MKGSEFLVLILTLFLMTFILGFSEFTVERFLYSFIFSFFIILVFVIAQKSVANILGIDMKYKLWTFRQFWIKWHYRLNWDFPIWIVLPLLLSIISGGFLKWTAFLVFVTKTTAKKAAKKFSEIKEFDLALIASSGIFAVLVLSLILKLFTLDDFASIAVWFSFLNCLPIGNMNGTKILFGSKILWIFITVLTIVILLLIELTHIFATIFIALILAAIAAMIFYYFYYARTTK